MLYGTPAMQGIGSRSFLLDIRNSGFTIPMGANSNDSPNAFSQFLVGNGASAELNLVQHGKSSLFR